MLGDIIDLQESLAILHSIPAEIVVIDNNHIVVFINQYAQKKYSTGRFEGSDFKVGDSIFTCHKNERSHQIIRESYSRLKKGENIVYMFDSKMNVGMKVYMIAVRNTEKEIIGYFEWYSTEL